VIGPGDRNLVLVVDSLAAYPAEVATGVKKSLVAALWKTE